MDIQQNNVAVLHFNLVNQDGSTIFIRKTKLATFNLINPSAVSVPITDIGFDATLNQCWVRIPKASNAATGQYYGVLNIVDDDWGTYTTSKIKVYSVVSDADEDTKSVVFTATCIATQITNPSGGNSPYYNTTTGTWWQYSDTLKAFEDTGVGNLTIYDISDYEDEFILTDPNGNVIFKIDSNGANSKLFNLLDANGNIVASLNKEFMDSMRAFKSTYFADKIDENAANPDNNYKGQFIICDNNGNVIFKIDSDGMHSNNLNSLTFEQITTTIAKVYSSTSYSKVFFRESKLAGKTILVIGDSLTAANKWQVKAAEILGCTQVTHALGGGGIINFVDGGTNSNGSLAALNSTDVTGKDAIVIFGPYNDRVLMGSMGIKTDMYPNQQTLWGKMNYMFKRIYQELKTANNLQCKIFFAGVHAYGAYPYNDKTAYQEYPSGTGYTGKDFSEKLKEICGWNGVQYIDLFNNSGINSYTWNKYQASPQPNANDYIGYVNGRGAGINDPFPDLSTLNSSIITRGFVNGDKATVTGYVGYYSYNGTTFDATPTSSYYPWVADQLHCNDSGYNLIGNYIATIINSFINN